MTDDDLGCIESRANAASPGPWVFDERGAIIRGPEGRVAGSAMVLGFHENMEFIAAARDDVPELVAEVRRLRVGFLDMIESLAGCEHMDDVEGILAAVLKREGFEVPEWDDLPDLARKLADVKRTRELNSKAEG